MQLAAASFALAVVLLFGVHHVRAQIQLIAPDDPGVTGNIIGESFCSSSGAQVQCIVANCDSLSNSGAFTYVWSTNNGVLIQDNDFRFEISTDTATCTSILAVRPGIDASAELTCTVQDPATSESVSETSFLFPLNIFVSSVHLAFGFSDQGIMETAKTFQRVVEDLDVPYPFLGETMRLTCEYGALFTPEQFQEYVRLFQPFNCVSRSNVDCGYETGSSDISINVTFDEFEDPIHHTCAVSENFCGRGLNGNTVIHIRDPAIIHASTTANADSVTTPMLTKRVNEMVTICCNHTGIGVTTAEWTAATLDGADIELSPPTYTIDNSMGQTIASRDPGQSCISFVMQPSTVGKYNCTLANNVVDPPGEDACTTVTLDGVPPDARLDQTFCLNVDVPDETVLLDCAPTNEAEPADPFMYQWTLGTTVLSLPDTQSAYLAPQVGNYTCVVSNSIGTAMTMFEVVANPMAQITIDVVDAMGASPDRFVGTIGEDMAELYHLQFGDTVTLTCDNTRGEENVEWTIPNNMISNRDFTITDITVESFSNGTYSCNLNDPSYRQCPSSNDAVTLRLAGVPPDIPPPNGNNVNIVGGNFCLPVNGQVVLVCTVQSGTPTVLYEWRIDGSSNVVSTEETYTVTTAGSYQCTAINQFGQDRATSIVADPPQAVLTFTVTGETGETLTDSCSRLIEPLPDGSNVTHCPYVGDDIEVCCTSKIPSSEVTIIHQHNSQTSPDGKFRFTDAKITDRAVIAGEYLCRAEVKDTCGTQVTGYAQLYDPAVVDREIPIPESTGTTTNVGIGRQATPVPIPSGNEVVIFCPYSGLDDPTGRTFFFAVDSEGNTIEIDTLPSPKYTTEQREDVIVLTISEYLPNEDMYHTFACITMNQAGRDKQHITLQEDFVAWCTDAYGQCDMECHLGVRTRNVYCCQRDTRTPVDESRCDDLTKPAEVQRCLEFGPCQLEPMWLPLPWSACSVTCGGGYRVRELECVIPGRNNMLAPAGSCDNLPLPVIFEYCNLESCCQADVNHSFCKLIANTPLCNQPAYQEVCCWTCQTYFYS